MAPLYTLVADFSGDGERLGVVRYGFVKLSLGPMDLTETAENSALTALVADFSGDGERLGVVRNGWLKLALGLVDESETAKGLTFPFSVRMHAKNLERGLAAPPGLGISTVSALNIPQLHQPLRLNQRQLPLFV